ncbi:MAG: TldD/PmbA family protein [Planctomycetota bacterium]
MASRSAEAAEIIFEESEVREVVFENNRLKYVTTKEERGMGLRVIKEGRIGFSSTTDLSNPDRLVANALASAQFGQEAKFTFPSRCVPTEVNVFDKAVAAQPVARAVDEGRGAIDAILTSAPDVQCSAGVDRAVSAMRIFNTNGLDAEVHYSDYGIGLSALRVQGESLIEIGEGEEHRSLTGRLDGHAAKILEKLALCRREINLPSETLPVLFMPKVVEVLLESLLVGTNGKTVQKGASPLAGKIGEKMLDGRVRLCDDPTVHLAPGSTPMDAEGLPCRETVLFDGGVLRSFIFDLQTAGLMGTQSTGHGMRGFTTQPSPGYTNIILSTGALTLREMLREMKRGLIVEQVLGEGQSNVLAGEFSVNLDLAFLVENGEIVGRVKDCMVAGNVFDLWKEKLLALGREAEWQGALCAPPVLLDAVSVAGTE